MNMPRLGLALLPLLGATSSFAQQPERICLTWAKDPATSQTVNWRSAPGQKAIVEFKTGAKKSRLTADSRVVGTWQANHLTMTSLSPNTEYSYRVGDGVDWSAWKTFRTTGKIGQPFDFMYFGDAQNDIRAKVTPLLTKAYQACPKAKFWLFAGDLVGNWDDDQAWGDFFYAQGKASGEIPIVPTPGNHDTTKKGSDSASMVTPFWNSFGLPRNGVKGIEDTVFYVDVQGVRVISLNSNLPKTFTDQATWLKKVVASNPGHWTVVTFHHPVYSGAHDRDNKAVRDAWKDVIESAGVDLVLQGHDHIYGRSWSSNRLPDSKSGHTVYLTSVCGPKNYVLQKQPWMARAAQGVQCYQVIHVTDDKLDFSAYTLDGKLYDEFTVNRSASGEKHVIDLAPKTPEIVNPTARD